MRFIVGLVLMTAVAVIPASPVAAQSAGTQGAARPGQAARPGEQGAARRGQAPAKGAQAVPAAAAKTSPGAGPVIVFETVKGTFEIETYPNEAPKSVEHILTLVKRRFYNGLRIHRLEPGFVVQFGDPQTRDMTKRDMWGRRSSGRAIGAGEISPKRPHRLGSVALAHGGDPRDADSQMYITLAGMESPSVRNIQGDYTVIGQVISGMDVVRKLQVTDVIRRATVR